MVKLSYSILLTDDSINDRLLMRQALRKHPRLCLIGELGDGAEAIAYLKGEGKFQNRQQHPFPDLLILDLDMPRQTGFEVLAWLLGQKFSRLRVVVASSSVRPEDCEQSLALGADAFHVKSASRQGREAMICGIEKLLDQPRARRP
jgi:CheY-like chemotaxis protein